MEKKNLIQLFKKTVQKRNLFALLLLFSLLSNFFLSIGILNKKTPIIVVPTQLQNKVVLSNGRIEQGTYDYLIGLARDFLAVTMELNPFHDDPADLKWRKRKILELSSDDFGFVYANSFEKQYKDSKRYFRTFIQPNSWSFDGKNAISCQVQQKIFNTKLSEQQAIEEKKWLRVTLFFSMKNYEALVSGIKIEPMQGEKS